jgi:hypothetical protein
MLIGLFGFGAAPAGNLATPGDEFLQVIQSAKTEFARRGWRRAEDVQIDVRPLRNDARSAGPGAFIDDPETVRLRSNILARERIPLGDLEVAERCNYLGTMRRLILEPASPEELRLVEFCREVFRGLTLGVSLPSEAANGERRYRVLAMGDDKELIMDILIRPGVEAAEVRIVPQFSF